MNREQQIEFMESAKVRRMEHVQRLLDNPRVIELLRKYDHKAVPKGKADEGQQP